MILLILLISGLTLATLRPLLNRSTQKTPPILKKQDAPKTLTANWAVEDSDLNLDTPAGQVKIQIAAKKAVHHPTENQTLLNNPRVTLYHLQNPLKIEWAITAKTGILFHVPNETRKTIQKIDLIDNIEIIHYDPKSSKPITLTTTLMSYDPDKEQLYTFRPVQITAEDQITTAVGLIYDRKTAQMRLLSHVKSIYTHNASLDTALKPPAG
jgi:LPS export ABC transporter protein LptC